MSSVFLQGNFAPVTEERTDTGLTVTGRVPDFLDGRYLRNGPNPVRVPAPGAYHWFTGDGMVHAVRLRGGRAEWYRNRWVRSPAVAARLGAMACGCTTRPKVDPLTGELHAVSYRCGRGSKVRYSVVDAGGNLSRAVDIEIGGSAMMHDFSLTESRVILYDLPVTYDAGQGSETTLPGTNGRFPYRWNPDYPARIGVMPRRGDARDVRWFDVGPCAVLHTLNAYDCDDTIVCDVVRYGRLFDSDLTGPSEGRPTLYRWTIDLPYGKVREEPLDDRVQEFPRVDDRLTGRKHRYGYAPRFIEGPGELLKHDLDRGEDIVCSFGDGRQPGEFTFVPRSPDAAEDDGVLMGYVYAPGDRRSSLEVLDASSLETVASVRLPARVPYGFHGTWIPSPSEANEVMSDFFTQTDASRINLPMSGSVRDFCVRYR